jgi:hypothetical protein
MRVLICFVKIYVSSVLYKILEQIICILLVYYEVGCFDNVAGISSPSWTISKG